MLWTWPIIFLNHLFCIFCIRVLQLKGLGWSNAKKQAAITADQVMLGAKMKKVNKIKNLVFSLDHKNERSLLACCSFPYFCPRQTSLNRQNGKKKMSLFPIVSKCPERRHETQAPSWHQPHRRVLRGPLGRANLWNGPWGQEGDLGPAAGVQER